VANAALLTRIRELHEVSDGTFGAPRMWEELTFEEISCSPNRVARLMRQARLQGIPIRRRRGGRRKKSRPVGIEDHLGRDFVADRPNHKWVTDLTEIPTDEGKLYLATVQDLYSKKVVGWATSSRQTRDLVLQAVLMALWQREDNKPVILHSDQGSQFTSGDYQRFLKRHNLTCSMGAVGTCADNAAAESFYALFKRDRVHRRRYATRAEARADVFDYIERFHNPRMQRRLIRQARKEATLTQPSTESG
jgi:putative transposase